MILKRDQDELHLTLQPNHPAAACVQHGTRIIKRLKDQDYGLRAFVFEDPDGNRIDVGQPLSPSNQGR